MKRTIIVVCIILIFIVIIVFIAYDTPIDSTPEVVPTPTVQPSPAATAEPTVTPEPTAAPTPIPARMQEALVRAKEILDFDLSKANIHDMLILEEFTEEEINYAFDTLIIDWNEVTYNRALYCHAYLYLGKQKLIAELKFERFTDEQIKYAINKIFD